MESKRRLNSRPAPRPFRDEPELSSDGGALLLWEAARINGIIPTMLLTARGLPGCRGVGAHCRAGLRRARHLTRNRAAPAVVTNGGKGESARILTFPTEPAYITGRTGHQAAAA